MRNRELIVPICLKNGKAVSSLADRDTVLGDAAALAASYGNLGADALMLFDLSGNDAEHDATISLIKAISRATDLPLYGGGNIRRMEDVKKLIYAGCKKVFLNYGKEENCALTDEVSARFGRERILACVRTASELQEAITHATMLNGVVLLDRAILKTAAVGYSQSLRTGRWETGREDADREDIWEDIYCIYEEPDIAPAVFILSDNLATGIFGPVFQNASFDFMEAKHVLVSAGIAMNTYESSIEWADLKLGPDGLIPVVVQDYKTQDVLMVAYMNEEAFAVTIRTGRMTYWSRSRKELWVKGLTSGHFQYVRELAVDCDNDTLLAKVVQIGAACHTGNRSCFYRTILKKNYDAANPLKVFEDVFAVIEDRKIHPKEGSYTNYLFEKGLDKILKKVGEEATEIIIAAKNPDPEEIKYEISDFLYHIMVLMAERGVTWEDITEELAKR